MSLGYNYTMISNEHITESDAGLYQVHHRNGTVSFIGDTKKVQKNIPFAFRNSSQPLSEADLLLKLQEAALPIKGTPTQILGWGGDSICFRITNGDSHYAAVLRSNRNPENWEHLMEHWDREQEINRTFAPYTLPQSMVVVNGIDNQPAVLKVTPEVNGAPMSEVSAAYLFVNNQLMEQYIDVTKRNLRNFISSGIIADPIGHIRSSRIKSLFERYGLFFFNTSNFMIDFQGNNLVVVDCESDDIKKQPPHRKVQLLSRAFGMSVNIAILEAFRGFNFIRDKVFPDRSLKTEVESTPGIDQFKQGFAETVSLFKKSGLNIRIVGSFATSATINNAGGEHYLTPNKKDRTSRDIDVLVLDPNIDRAKELADTFNARRKQNPYFPKIELTLPRVFRENEGFQESRPVILPVVVTRTAFDEAGGFHLAYEGKHIQLPNDYLNPVEQTYEGIRFPTLAPGVLAGLYLTRMGVFKSKDTDKVTDLLILTGAKIPTEFIDFSKVIRTGWPDLYKNFLTREFLYHFSGGFIRKGLFTELKSKLVGQG